MSSDSSPQSGNRERNAPSAEVSSADSAIDHSHCAGHGAGLAHVKLTPSRQAMLDILCNEGKPLGAYDLIDRIALRSGKRPAPISVYRVLDFLVEHGLAHRLSSRNAFLACARHHGAGEPLAFLICDKCGAVSEQTSPALRSAIDALAEEASFKRRTQVIELTGTCASCRPA
ncbi:MAG: transcriptional repressor [Hyphomicrobiales bacterium]|nr:transcriptional repressor [Hyphomicrobiales bacterium]